MGIDILFMGNPELGYECFSARSMIEYLPDDLSPMVHLPWNPCRISSQKLRDYVELLRIYTRRNDPSWDLRHPTRSRGVYAVRAFIRTAKKYLEHNIGAYISM
jgi:hypothetical protein